MKFNLKSRFLSSFFLTPVIAFAGHGDKCAMGSCGGCAGKCAAFFVGWWLLSSALLFVSWNHVVATLTNVKKAKFWQALIVVATMAAFCAPKCGHWGRSKSCSMSAGHKCNHHGSDTPEAPSAVETK